MTVQAYEKASLAANNDTVDFAFTFEYFATSEVVVTLRDEDGAETTLTEADYDITTTGGSPYTGGSVKTGETYDTGNTIVISRSMTLTQATDLTAGGTLPADTLENQYDRIVMILQDQQEQLDRCPKFPITDSTSISAELDNSIDRASNYALYDGTGAPSVASSVISAASYEVGTFVQTLLSANDAPAFQVLIGLLDENDMGGGAGVDTYPVTQQSLVAYIASSGLTFTAPVIAAYTMTGTGTIANGCTLTTPVITSAVLNTGVSGTAVSTSGTLTENSDTKLASQKATKTYVDAQTGGVVVQVVSTQTGAVNHFDNYGDCVALPSDTTIPQNDEGNEVMARTITPTSGSNALLIQVIVNLDVTLSAHRCVALFYDDNGDALACTWEYGVLNQPSTLTLTHYMTSPGTSEYTFKVRIGASAGNYTFNGDGKAPRYGGKLASSITITELTV